MHNKLRRAIEQEQRASYDQPHEKIAAQSALLTRALMALGGPVDSERPPQETAPGTGESVATVMIGSITTTDEQIEDTVFVVGRDTGDENDYAIGYLLTGDDHDPK